MPLNYNFAFKNSKLNKWEKPLPKNIIGSRKTFKETLIYSFRLLNKNPDLFYPPGLILLMVVVIQLINLYPISKINRLEDDHIQYERLSRSLSGSESRIKSMKRFLEKIKGFHTDAMPSYLFAYYLQRSIPQGIQLNEYFVSNNEFIIDASAYEIESLNQMITLLINSPIINKESLSIKEIIKQDSSGSANIAIQVEGTILKLKPEKRKILYNEAFAHGLSTKLSRYNFLEKFLIK